MDLALSPRIVIEANVEGFQKLLDQPVILVRKAAGRYTLFERFDFYGCSVFIATTNEDRIFTLQAEVASVYVR